MTCWLHCLLLDCVWESSFLNGFTSAATRKTFFLAQLCPTSQNPPNGNKRGSSSSSNRSGSAGQTWHLTSAASSAAAAEPVIVYPKTQQMKDLEAYLLKIAPAKEVLIGVSNVNPLREGMLDTFLSGVKQASITNYLIVALDKETEQDLQNRDINVFYMPIEISKAQEDTGANHAVSALKFGIIKKFLQLGWAVLLSDIDICVLQNPFKFLYRWGISQSVSPSVSQVGHLVGPQEQAAPVGRDWALALGQCQPTDILCV